MSSFAWFTMQKYKINRNIPNVFVVFCKYVSQRAWHRVTLIQILVSILTAIGTTLGVTSCMGYGPIAML